LGSNASRLGSQPDLGVRSFLNGTGRATNFDASVAEGWLQVADAAAWSLTATGELTVMCWVWMDVEDGAASTLVAKRNSTSPLEWIMRQLTSGDSLNVQFNTTGGADIADASGGSVVVGRWFMTAFTAKSSTTTLRNYVNGIEVVSDTVWSGSLHDSSAPLSFGWWPSGDTGQGFDGRMAHVAIFDRVLGPGVIRKLWAAGRRGIPASRRMVA
jgi:hypothetical protein